MISNWEQFLGTGGSSKAPTVLQVYHKGGIKAMRKLRRFLQVLLFINFIVGLAEGMRAGNLAAILINGIVVLAIVSKEKKEK